MDVDFALWKVYSAFGSNLQITMAYWLLCWALLGWNGECEF